MLRLIAIEFKRGLLMLRRYPVEMAGQLVVITLIFYGLFLGARYVAGPAAQFGDRLDALIVGYVLWTLTMFAVGDLSWGLMSEAREGTLEQVFLSPFGPLRVYLARNLAALLVVLAFNLAILLVLLVLTGARLRFVGAALWPLLAALLSAYGIGYALGAMALYFKRIQAFLNLFQFVMMFLIMAPLEQAQGPARLAGALLPVAPAAGILRDLLARGLPFDPGAFAVALFNGLFYLALGLWLFLRAVHLTKRRGLLGGY